MVADIAIHLENVVRGFGGFKAVDDVTMSIVAGQRRAILGPNGAGKTTLFNLISGDLSPTAGTVTLFGTDVSRFAPHRRARLGIARTYQNSLLFDGLTVFENLYVAARGVRANRFSLARPSARGDDVAEVLTQAAMVGLDGRLDAMVGSLAHGERRLLELGMALTAKPRVLMLDEPAAGLSPGERPRLLRLLQNLPKQLTLILVEHDMDIALPIADIVTIMKDGAVVVEDTPDGIINSTAVQAIYLGGDHA